MVAFRDNTTMSACVITPVEMPWGGKKMPVCAKHAPFISMTKSKRKIGIKEAFYISGVLNTPIVKEYISLSNDNRSFSIDLTIKLPEYDEKDKNFLKISNLSKKAHKISPTKNNLSTILNEIEKYYLKICLDCE